MAIVWDRGETAHAAWSWVARDAGAFGTVGGEIPAGFAAHVSVPNSGDPEENHCSLARPQDRPDQLDRLLDVIGGPSAQVLHAAIWDGFGGMFREEDGTVSGLGVAFGWDEDGEPWSSQEIERERRRRMAELAARLPTRPRARTFSLPHRDYYTWTTTISRLPDDACALDGLSPTIVFPADRSWLWHSEIDSRRTEIGGSADLLAPLLGPAWAGLAVERSDRLSDIPAWSC